MKHHALTDSINTEYPEGTSLSDLGEDSVCSIWVLAVPEGLSEGGIFKMESGGCMYDTKLNPGK